MNHTEREMHHYYARPSWTTRARLTVSLWLALLAVRIRGDQ